ncbi:MAG: hypothetical protein Wins2KO_09820 [Winogradskyella sp.]|uniref:hypothetical protein n=1 Tax=Winogradskyella sp. TaxID=1883156 RepID=UPI0025D5F824|nr:hypothetical protein [Winogradskyella sp.]NRB60384.1 hypothetical protein [Winogradskyella sp.]
MNAQLSNIVTEIQKLATTSQVSEEDILNEVNAHYESLRNAKFVEAYLNRQQKVSEICKAYRMSPKRLYKILKAEGVEIKEYKKS